MAQMADIIICGPAVIIEHTIEERDYNLSCIQY